MKCQHRQAEIQHHKTLIKSNNLYLLMYVSPVPAKGRFPTHDAPEIKRTDKFKITDAACEQRL